MHGKILEIMSIRDRKLYVCILQERIPILIPEIKATYSCDGGPHHAETVFRHLVLTSSHVSPRFPLLRFAAFLHDIGKPATYKDGMFRGHAKAGAEIAEKIMRRLGGFSDRERDFVTALIETHMMAPLGRMRESRIAVKFLRLRERGVDIRDFVRLRLADKKGNMRRREASFSTAYPRYLLSTIKTALDHARVQNHNPLAVTGNDVMRLLDIAEGPEVGKILREIAEKCPNDDREALLSAIRSYGENPSSAPRM